MLSQALQSQLIADEEDEIEAFIEKATPSSLSAC
jgi:hypothetical protein